MKDTARREKEKNSQADEETRTRGGNLSTFPDTKAGLEGFFLAACDVFNKNSDDTIDGALDENVTVFSISQHTDYNGISAVERYFKDQFLDSPQFNPLAYNVDISSDNLSGSIVGTAKWLDENGKDSLHFVFKCIWNSNKNRWLFLNLYAW